MSITGYAHTIADFVYPFNSMTNYLFKAKNEKPSLQASWEAWTGNHIYSFVWYQYKNDFNAEKFSSYNFNFDIANLTPEGVTSDLDQREPSRAFAVVGGKGWSLEIGRDRLLMGAGVSGSLIVSSYVNPRLLQWLGQFNGQGKCFGSIRTDHMSKELAHVIYSCNLFE